MEFYIFLIASQYFFSFFFRLYRFTIRSDDSSNVHGNALQQKPILTLYTKNPCPLCDELVQELAPFMHRLHLEKVDITKPENRKYFKQYRYDIPVLHINGEFLCMHRFTRLDAEKLDSKLCEIQNSCG